MKQNRTKIRNILTNLIYYFHKKIFYLHYKKITELLVPNLLKLEKIRLGREGDGTYVLPSNLINQDCVLISLGIADDISFEKDFINLYPKSKTFAYDPSIPSLPEPHSSIIFRSKGIAGKRSKNRNLVTFKDIVNENNINAKNQMIIKMDIEGWEWSVFDKTNLNDFNIPVIALEIHFVTLNTWFEMLFFPYYFYRRLIILRKILKHYFIFHLHANNYGYFIFKKFNFPTLIEITIIRKNIFFEEIIKETKFLNGINCKDRPDYQFHFFN